MEKLTLDEKITKIVNEASFSTREILAKKEIPEEDIAIAIIYHGKWASPSAGGVEATTIGVYRNGKVQTDTPMIFGGAFCGMGCIKVDKVARLNYDSLEVTDLTEDSITIKAYHKDSPESCYEHKFEAKED